MYRLLRPLVERNGMRRYRGQQAGLRGLLAEAAMLSERARPQDAALNP
jgi:hypothetical protein